MAPPVDSATDCERDDGREKCGIEVTPEMIDAGFKVFSRSGLVDEPLEADKLFLDEIYRAMASCSPRSTKGNVTLDDASRYWYESWVRR